MFLKGKKINFTMFLFNVIQGCVEKGSLSEKGHKIRIFLLMKA